MPFSCISETEDNEQKFLKLICEFIKCILYIRSGNNCISIIPFMSQNKKKLYIYIIWERNQGLIL